MIITDHLYNLIEFTRNYLAIFYSLVAVFYASRIFLLKRSTNSTIIFPGERFCSTWWNHMLFRVFRGTIWAVCVLRVFVPATDNYLGIITGLENYYTILLGNTLLTLGFLVTITVHYSHGKAWRSGIAPNGPSEIISHGFYRYSRNPIFLAVATSQLGFFLALPSIFSLTCLLTGFYTLNRQALSEEEHLSKLFPDTYGKYASVVRRWI